MPETTVKKGKEKTIRVGALVTSAAIVLMVFLFFIGSEQKIFSRKNEYKVQLDTVAGLAEGNPVMSLERGEKAEMPPVLYLQAEKDNAHPRPHLKRFVAAYRKAGGQVELELYDAEGSGFLRDVSKPAGAKGTARLIEFIQKNLR